MRKIIITTVLFIALVTLSSFILFLYLRNTNTSESRVLGIQNENQFYYFFNETQSLTFSESAKEANDNNSIKVEWTASYKYPYLSDELMDISIAEGDLVWKWTRTANQVTGESSIESSPITLKYYIDKEVMTGEITIENNTTKTIESLQYVLKIEHPPSYKLNNGQLTQSKGNKKKSLKITSQGHSGELVPNFEGKEKSSSNYILDIGDVKPKEISTTIFHFSYD